MSLCSLLRSFAVVIMFSAAPSKTLAQSQGPSGGPSGAGTLESDQPIDISADNLEVRQDKNLAIFTGINANRFFVGFKIFYI